MKPKNIKNIQEIKQKRNFFFSILKFRIARDNKRFIPISKGASTRSEMACLPARQGFTLIELLTSITIIGILAVIIITSLSSSRVKANDSKVKTQLARFRSAAELYFSNQKPPSYGPPISSCSAGLFGNTSTSNGNPNSYINTNNLPVLLTVVCGSSDSAYAVKITSPTGEGYWCVDSTNRLVKENGNIGSSATVCP